MFDILYRGGFPLVYRKVVFSLVLVTYTGLLSSPNLPLMLSDERWCFGILDSHE